MILTLSSCFLLMSHLFAYSLETKCSPGFAAEEPGRWTLVFTVDIDALLCCSNWYSKSCFRKTCHVLYFVFIWVAKHRVTCFNVDFSACNIAMHIMSRVSLLTLIGSVLTSCLWECEEEEGTLPYGPSGSNAKSVVFSGRNWWSCFYVRTLMKCSREHSWKCVSYLPLSVFKWLFLTIFDNRNHEELTRLLASAV